jgi:hypothetical protein
MLFTIASCASYQLLFQSMGSDNQPHPNSVCSILINGPYGRRHTKIWCNNPKHMFIPPSLLHFHGVRNCPIIPHYHQTNTYNLLREKGKSLHCKHTEYRGCISNNDVFLKYGKIHFMKNTSLGSLLSSRVHQCMNPQFFLETAMIFSERIWFHNDGFPISPYLLHPQSKPKSAPVSQQPPLETPVNRPDADRRSTRSDLRHSSRNS